MKALLALLITFLALPAFPQAIWRNFFTTNQNPLVTVVAGSNATVQASTVGVNQRVFTVNAVPGNAAFVTTAILTNQVYASNVLGAVAEATHSTNANNATYITTATITNQVYGTNIVGYVSEASHATNADNAMYGTNATYILTATITNQVYGSNVVGSVSEASHSTNSDLATFVTTATITNQVYASNVVSGGQTPAGTIEANVGWDGSFLQFSNLTRVWGANADQLTNTSGYSVSRMADTNWINQQIANIGLTLYTSGTTNAGALDGRTNNWQAWNTPIATPVTNTITWDATDPPVNAYLRQLVSTNTFSNIKSGPISVKCYFIRTGGGTLELHPEFYLFDTVEGTLFYEAASAVKQTIAATATPVAYTWTISSTALTHTNPVKYVVSWKLDTKPNNGSTLSFVSGGSYDSHANFVISLSGSTINANQVVGAGNLIYSNSATARIDMATNAAYATNLAGWLPENIVNRTNLMVNAVAQTNITENSVARTNLMVNSVAQTNILENSVARTNLMVNSVAQTNITENSVARTNLMVNSVAQTNLVENSVAQTNLMVNSVAQTNILENSVARTNLMVNSVAQTNLLENSVARTNLMVNSVAQTNIVENSIAQTNIMQNSVARTNLMTDSVSTTNIVDASISTNKMDATAYVAFMTDTTGTGSSNITDNAWTAEIRNATVQTNLLATNAVFWNAAGTHYITNNANGWGVDAGATAGNELYVGGDIASSGIINGASGIYSGSAGTVQQSSRWVMNSPVNGSFWITDSTAAWKRFYIYGPVKALTDETACELFYCHGVHTNGYYGGVFDYCIYATDATDSQVVSGTAWYQGVNPGGVFTATVTNLCEGKVVTTGTLGVTFDAVGRTSYASTNLMIRVTPDTSLTIGSGKFNIIYQIRGNSTNTITVP